MKIPKSVLLETALIVGAAVLFKVVLVFLNAQVGTFTTIDTTGLPVYSGHVTIVISNQEFRPAILVVIARTKITWINHDSMAHTVTEGQNASPIPHGFNSNLLPSGQSWSYVFKVPGIYLYTCEFHPSMNARVIVK
jgi:plastocyanin